MIHKLIVGLVILITLTQTACKQRIPYTKEVQKKYNLTETELTKLQFRLVNDIVLSRGSKQDISHLDDGDILISESSNLDKIIFKSGTHGVFVKFIGENKIAVAFEPGDDMYLEFGAISERGVYKLQADDWSNSGRGTLKYGGETYTCSSLSSRAYIMVRVKKSRNYNSNQRIVGGRKI